MSEAQRAEVPSSALRVVHFACRALLVLLLGGTAASAQTAATQADPDNTLAEPSATSFPTRPADSTTRWRRIVSQKLSEAWGVPVVVENRPGGGTLIGTESVAKAAPDGYTLLGVAFPFGANPSIYKPALRHGEGFHAADLRGPDAKSSRDKAFAADQFRAGADRLRQRRIPARSATAPPASALPTICRWSCSRAWPGSTSCTCPTRAARRW